MPGIFFAGNFLSQSTGVLGICEELSAHFQKHGWQVFTASRFRNRILKMADFLWKAWHYRKCYDLASVEIYSYLAFRWADLLCLFLRLLKKPYVLTLHGGRLAEFAGQHPRKFGALVRSAEIVTTPSKFLQANLQCFREDIVYIPNGIYLSRYPFLQRHDPQPRIIWLRALHQVYNPQLAIHVLKNINESFSGVFLTMAGPDKKDGTLEKLTQLIAEYQLVDKLKVAGAIPKDMVSRFMAEGDIFLNTTNFESFGVSVLEAAACGLCIVTTDAGELPFLWEDGVDALIVPVNDVDTMSAAVKRILTDPDLAGNLSTNARKKAEGFDWAVILPMWENLFFDLIGKERDKCL